MATPKNGEPRTSVRQDQTRGRHPFDGLFTWGDGFQAATGIAPADIDQAVKQVRLDEAQTPPSPMDAIRSMLTDIEAAMQQRNPHAVALGFDEVINALMVIEERCRKQAGTWAAHPDMQSGSVLAAELPDLPASLVAMHRAGVLRTLHEDKRDNG